jgi:preprotein translocase subunit YajC
VAQHRAAPARRQRPGKRPGSPEVFRAMRSGSVLIVYVLLIAAFWFVLVRPQRRRLQAQRNLQSSLELGDEVVTIGGLFGTIRRFDNDIVTLELSPGVEARVTRRAISGKVTSVADDGGQVGDGDDLGDLDGSDGQGRAGE